MNREWTRPRQAFLRRPWLPELWRTRRRGRLRIETANGHE